MANVCACGCGELLPENSARQYKRGHKARLDNPQNVTAESGENMPDDPFTLEDAAAQTPDDPEPRDAPEWKPKTVIKVTASIRRDVEGKLAFLLGMSAQLWSLPDPLCGNMMLEHSGNIAKKLTPIICQSPDVVKWFTKGNNYILWLDLLMACTPVMQLVFMHHVIKSVTAESMASPNGQGRQANMYVVQ